MIFSSWAGGGVQGESACLSVSKALGCSPETPRIRSLALLGSSDETP